MNSLDPIEIVKHESSVIDRTKYIPREWELIITFRSGRQYVYYKVKPQLYERFLKAESKGQFFNQYIKNKFDYVLY